MSEQGDYVFDQVSFVEICDLVSRRKNLESSGHQLGVDSETFLSFLGKVSTLHDPAAFSTCLYWSTSNGIILTVFSI